MSRFYGLVTVANTGLDTGFREGLNEGSIKFDDSPCTQIASPSVCHVRVESVLHLLVISLY